MFEALRHTHLLPILTAASLIGATSCAAIAADVSPWEDDAQSAARLISARAVNESGGRMFRAGVEIKLKDGWKTYWRYPGDSGVPPLLDFSKSQNLKAVVVRYPAPTRFSDGAGGNSIGYKGTVILPLHVVAQDASKPVTLNLKLDYAVCEKLCVPAEAKLELLLTGAETANEAALDAAEARVPKAVAVGDGGTPSIRTVRREAGSGKPRDAIRGRSDRAVGFAAAGADGRRARGIAALRLRAGWAAARRARRRRLASAHGGRRRQGH
jgi:DsbC/DsbD-like thiol-disulfide interchange protein